MNINSVGEVKRCILISGMHRSGTSCLTGTAQQAGLHLGNVHTENPHNIKGNRENPDAMELNDRILERSHASWDRPQPCSTEPTLVGQCQTIVTTLHDAAPGVFFGLKDPRLLFTRTLWESALCDIPVQYLISFRHPLAVARSLQKRNGWDVEQGLELWSAYNTQALKLAETRDVRWVNFDWEPATYQHRVAQLLAEIGLSRKDAPTEPAFYETELVHHRDPGDRQLPGAIDALHAELCERSAAQIANP